MSGPVIWGNVPPRNPNFTGRDKLLAELRERMRGGTTAVLPHALCGMGGVGKSHLALQYVYLYQHEYDLIWWIPAERTAQIGAAMVELAERMNRRAGADAGLARAAVVEALRLGEPYERWLLVFDNADGPAEVRPYLPPGGPGNVLITSRNPRWASVANPLEVDVLTRSESVRMLRRRGPELDDRDADRLAEVLGDLPLALEQAAALRAETGMSADEYLRFFSRTEQQVELLAQHTSIDYSVPVAAAWNVSLDRLAQSSRAAFRLLQLCSFLAPQPIPRALLAGAHHTDIHPELDDLFRDPMRLNQAIRDITRYALARIDHRGNSLQMHRLVQAVVRDRMSEPGRRTMTDSAHLLLASGDHSDPDTPAAWFTYAALYPHVDASGAIHATDPRVRRLVQNEARYLYWSGEHRASLELCQRAYDSWRERLGADHPSTLSIGHQLGFMLFTLGRFPEAAEHNRQILAAYERTNQDDTEDLLRQAGAVAADLRVAGEFAEALRVEEDLYRRHVRLLGPEDPNTLNAAHNLAVSLRLIGDARRAYDVDHEVYEQRVLLFGGDHPLTIDSQLKLVVDRRELGDYLGARDGIQEIVDRLLRVQGAESAQALRARSLLASTLRKAGDHAGALALSERIWADLASRYREDNPAVLLLPALGLLVDLRITGQLPQAIEFGEQIRDRFRGLLGEEHPYVVAAALTTAIAYRLSGDVGRARRTDQDGLAILIQRLGPDHPLTLAGSANLASDLYADGDVAAAHDRDQETVQRLRAGLGDTHPITLSCQANLAMDLLALDRLSEAGELQAEVVSQLGQRLGSEHPATLLAADLTRRADCDLDPPPL